MTREEIEKLIDDLEGATVTNPDGSRYHLVSVEYLIAFAEHFTELGRKIARNELGQHMAHRMNLLGTLDEAAEDSWALYEYRESPKGLYSTCYVDGFKAGSVWRDRQLNWARDLVQAGLDKPEEAVNILKRLKELIELLP